MLRYENKSLVQPPCVCLLFVFYELTLVLEQVSTYLDKFDLSDFSNKKDYALSSLTQING